MSSKTVQDGLALEGQTCIGCCACYNICPTGAIKMGLDEQGFSVCSIDRSICVSCGKCADICPQINPAFDNDHTPQCYAVRANDSVIGESSFGGALSLLCEKIISNGGFICGPVFDSDLNVIFKLMTDISELKRIKDTRYAPNDIGNIYKEIKEKVESNKPVMFIGNPCQVAGVRNFIGKKNNLITVDLLCEGLPSKGVYRQYLKEISEGKKITDIQFRPTAQPLGTTLIKFNDGSEKIRSNDLYLSAVSNDLIKYDACEECIYADMPRQGDISIGDLWKTNGLFNDVKLPQNAGCVILNNSAGKILFDESIKNAAYCTDIPLPLLLQDKRLQQTRPQHLARQRLFFMLSRKHSLMKSIEYSFAWKFDVGITGFWRANNYGGILTYYALYKLILNFGLEPLMIEARYNVEPGTVPSSPKILKAKYPYYHVSRYHSSLEDETELNNRVSKFVVGSDQVWNRNLLSQMAIECYAFDFVDPSKKIIAVSSSFGSNHLVGGAEEERERLIKLLQRFSHVSVRENSGVKLCSNYGIDATRILDPVMLCDEKHYLEMIATSPARFQDNYIFYYTGDVQDLSVEKIAEDIGCGTIKIDRYLDRDASDLSETPTMNIGTAENWVKCIYDSSFVVSDSFHATALAILFRKPFILFYGDMKLDSGLDRLVTLMETFNLNDRLFKNADDIRSEDLLKPIDYDRVHSILKKEQERSMEWIRKVLLE